MLLLIASFSLVSFVLAWFYASNPDLVTRRSNYGNLIDPALPLDYSTLIGAADTSDATLNEIKGRWVLLHVLAGSVCEPGCRKSLHATRQLRLMLNKDLPRVRRLLLRNDSHARSEPEEQDPDLLRGNLGPETLTKLTAAIGTRPPDGAVILLDPFGNAMMWYPPDFDPYRVLKDLKQLLRTSRIG